MDRLSSGFPIGPTPIGRDRTTKPSERLNNADDRLLWKISVDAFLEAREVAHEEVIAA